MAELTPDEELFFQTGELPASFLEEAAASAAAVQSQAEEENPAEPEVAEPTEPKEQVDPLGAINERLERMLEAQREAFKTELAELRASLAPKKPEVQAPNDYEDPLGSMIHKLNGLNEQVTSLKTELTEQQQQNLLKQQFEQFTNSVTEQKNAFQKATPDFPQAYEHIRTLRTEDLRAAGCPEKDIAKILLQDEFQLAQTAIQRGKNPAEEMYNMAKRYGYTAKSQPATRQTPEEKIAALKVGQAAAKHPDRAGVENPLNIDALKDASSADLNKVVQDDKLWNRIVGGAAADDLFS